MAAPSLPPYEVLLGVFAYLPLTFVGGLLPLAVNRILGGQVTIVRIGFGSILWQWPAGRGTIVQIQAVPITYEGATYLSRAGHSYRDQRIIYAAKLLGPLIAVGIAALLLPEQIALGLIAIAVLLTVFDLVSRHKGLGRSRLAWLLGASKQRGVRPAHLAQLAGHAADKGDFLEAERLETVLREQFDRPDLLALVDLKILMARGDPREVLAGGAPLPPDPPEAVEGQEFELVAADCRNFFAYLAIEADPACREEVSGYLYPLRWRTSEILGEQRHQALLLFDALERGDAAEAALLNRENLRTTKPTRPSLADDWCAQARIENMLGRRRKAARALKRARRFAPWYPRIKVVGDLVAASGREPAADSG